VSRRWTFSSRPKSDRHVATDVSVQLRGYLVGRQHLLAFSLDDRLVLVFREERGLIAQLQVHGVLDRGQLVLVVALRPGDHGPGIHLLAVLAIEGRGR
jgi:hypothetical protein